MTNSDTRRLAYWLLKDLDKAVREYKMISDGDRIAVAVSGGIDSLCLLRLLDWRRETAMEKYEIIAIHIIGDARGSACPTHQPLLNWLAKSGYDHVVEPLHLPKDEPLPLNCHRCTWNRRRTIFEIAHQRECNVVAFGHHADDFTETTLLNLLCYGNVESMAPVADYFDGIFRLIRPMCYLPQSEIRRFAKANDFPPPPPECPQSTQSNRQLAVELIRLAEQGCQNARVNLLRSGLEIFKET